MLQAVYIFMKRDINILFGVKNRLAICLLSGLLWLPSAQAQITNTNEFWLSISNNGNLLLNGATGTSNNPLDGHIEYTFDRNMRDLPFNSTVHIMPGLYLTRGIIVRSGVHILGSGMDATIIRLLPYSADGTIMISTAGQSGLSATNNVVSNLTLDCNYTSGSNTYAGIILEGTHHVISGVKLLNLSRMSLTGSEAWGLIIANWTPIISESNVIENCVISNFNYALHGHNLSAIGFLGGANISGATGIIRNNRIYGSVSNNPDIFGLLPTSGSVITGNYLDGVAVATRSEGGWTNVIFTNNIIKCCSVAVDYFRKRYLNITIANNQIELTNSVFNTMPVAFAFGTDDRNTSGQNIHITNNIITYVGTATNSFPVFIWATGLTNLIVLNNQVPGYFINYITNCSKVRIDSEPLDAPVLHTPKPH